MIHALLDATQVLGTLEIDGVTHEVCAEAGEAHEMANEVFATWRRKVSGLIPH